MPSYINSPYQTPKLIMKGVPCYLFGKYNYHQSPTQMLVTNITGSGSTATLAVQITGGEIPLVGSLISVLQTQTSGGAFNVSRALVTGVPINSTTGAGTITFASATSVASTPDTGSAIVDVPEIGETPTDVASIAACNQAPEGDSQFTVTTAVTFAGGVLPTAITVSLQAALHDVDSEYTTIGVAAVVAGGVWSSGPLAHYTLEKGSFYRFLISGLTIGSATGIVAKLTA